MHYTIWHSFNSSETGMPDASSQAFLRESKFSNKGNFTYYQDHFVDHRTGAYLNLVSFPEREYDLEYLKLAPRAKLTDFLYFGPSVLHQFLVNKRVQDLLKSLKTAPFKLYNAKLFGKNGPIDEDYKFLYFPYIGYEFVDFENSIFCVENKHGKDEVIREIVKIGSAEELKRYGNLQRVKIVLKNVEGMSDIFKPLICPLTTVSQNFFDLYHELKMTGLEFKPAKEFVIQ